MRVNILNKKVYRGNFKDAKLCYFESFHNFFQIFGLPPPKNQKVQSFPTCFVWTRENTF